MKSPNRSATAAHADAAYATSTAGTLTAHRLAALPGANEQPAVASANEHPAVSDANEQPAVAFANQQPAVSAANEQPAVAFANQQPAVAFANQQPAVASANEQSAVASANEQPAVASANRRPLKPLLRGSYTLIAYLSVLMGGIGLFLPLIPTTPFLLLALILLTKSNPKMAQWLLQNRILGVYLRSYVKRQQLPLRDKVRMILLVWISMGITIIYAVENLYFRIALVVVTIAVTVHIAMLRTRNYAPNEIPKDIEP